MSVQEIASQAASRAMAEAAKNITTPNSAYQFEVSWRGLSGDRALQACLLKVTNSIAVLILERFLFLMSCLICL